MKEPVPPLRGKERAVGQQGLPPEEEEEDQGVEDQAFDDPLSALVKNCHMLHTIVGPACVFLKQGFSQTFVCNRAHAECTHTTFSSHAD